MFSLLPTLDPIVAGEKLTVIPSGTLVTTLSAPFMSATMPGLIVAVSANKSCVAPERALFVVVITFVWL